MSREAFEAWALRNTSMPSAHEMAWAAWQAALAQQQAEPVLWVPPEREGEFHHDHSSVTGYRNRMAGWVPLYATPQQAQPTAPDVPEDDFGNMPMPSREKREEFERLCNALPPDVCWGDPITADIVRSIVATFTPAAPAVLEPIFDWNCPYWAAKGQICNKCGHIHRGIAAPGSADHG